jgi:hypothetical protein
MPTVSIDTITVLLRVAFLVGAVTDGLAVIPMLSRRIGAMLFGGGSSGNNMENRFAWGIGAALMTGWTLLLLWGAASPIGRRDIPLLTAFPVISGIVLANVMAARPGRALQPHQFLPRRRSFHLAPAAKRTGPGQKLGTPVPAHFFLRGLNRSNPRNFAIWRSPLKNKLKVLGKCQSMIREIFDSGNWGRS